MFLALPLLFGLGLVAIPVIIHLLHRQKPRPIFWGAMQFLLETPEQKKHRRHIDQWLLMLLRMAVLAFLAVMLARPLLPSGRFNPLKANLSTDVAVIIDHSLSMGRQSDGKTLFARGIEVAEQIADGLGPSDSLSVVLAEHQPRNFTPLPASGDSLQRVVRDLKMLKPGLTDSSMPAAVESARLLLAKGRNTRKVIITVADQQRIDWQIDNASAWRQALGDRGRGWNQAMGHWLVPLSAESKLPNASLTELRVQPNLIGVRQPAQVTVAVSNTGPQPLTAVPVQLVVDGRPSGSQVVTDLAPGQSRTLRFDQTFTDAGSHWLRVQTDVADALAADNAAMAAVNVVEKLPVLIIDGDLTSAGSFASSQFLAAALQTVEIGQEATALLQPKVVSVSDSPGIKLADYPVTVLNDIGVLPPEMIDRLAEYVKGGHGLWLILGPRSTPEFVNSRLAPAGLFPGDLMDRKTSDPPPSVEIPDPLHPALQLITAAERNATTGLMTRQWWSLKRLGGAERVVLSTGSGDPLVLDQPLGDADGRLAIWTTSVDGNWNNWPLAPNFVPLVCETIAHLCGPAWRATPARPAEAGGRIEWAGAANPAVESATLKMPDGRELPLKAQRSASRCVVGCNDTYTPGLYELRFAPSGVPQPAFFAVGIDRRELDATALADSDLAWLKGQGFLNDRIDARDVGKALGAANPGTEVWPYLAAGILALLLMETLLTRRMVRMHTAVQTPMETTVHPTRL